MSRPKNIHQTILVSLGLSCIAAAWWGCGASPEQPTSQASASSSSGAGGASSGSSSSGGTGGMEVSFDGGGGGSVDEGGACTSTSAATQHIQLDIVFLIDQSGSMSGTKWQGTVSALKTFFTDPASAKIGVGMSFFPNHYVSTCVPEEFEKLTVPIDVLPKNAYALTNAIPADAIDWGTPTYAALKGTLMAATAYQDAHPTHKVIVVLATDGDPNSCGAVSIDDIANLAKSARNYNGVLTYVIGVEGSTIANLNKIAVAGGTTAAYDITNDISQFSAKVAEIRKNSLGCDFEIPPPPANQELDPDKVNFAYMPQGVGMPKILLRADDLADCNGKPGWYYDNNLVPTKITLCPASCATVQADNNAKVSVLFGCKSLIN